jgi:hypothetical protein
MKISMMRLMKWGLLLGLTAYSLALLRVDLMRSWLHARGFFSDIIPGVNYPLPSERFFAINTSLTVVLLSGITLLFAISFICSETAATDRRRSLYCLVQMFFFAGLTLDERLQIHERAGALLGMDDAVLLLGLGVFELAVLFGLGRIHRARSDYRNYLLLAGILFAMMVAVDGWWPTHAPGRLSLEDLSKTWAITALFAYAWRYCLGRIFSLRAQAAKQQVNPA